MSEFSLLQYVKQYQNDALCAKWNNNIPAEELNQDDYSWSHGYQFLVDSQHVDSLCEQFTFLPREDITGIVYAMGDGDYSEVYVTESARPYDLQAIYHPLSYYVEK